MRWLFGTAGILIWVVALVGTVSAQRATVDPTLRDSIDGSDRRPIVPTQATRKRPTPPPAGALDAGRTDGTLPSKEQVNSGTVTIITAPELDFGRSRRRMREHSPCVARYGLEFLYGLGEAGT
jgi:hypothetical protein